MATEEGEKEIEALRENERVGDTRRRVGITSARSEESMMRSGEIGGGRERSEEIRGGEREGCTRW